MEKKNNPALNKPARALRKNMTREELHLWFDFLKTHPQKFIRQNVIGRYICDFYCPAAKLAIELDGSRHYSDEALIKDKERTAYIEQLG